LENKPTHITLTDFITHNGAVYETLNLSYQVFWCSTAPIILINHATGNSQVIGESGWWNDIVVSIKLLILENTIVLSFLMYQVMVLFRHH
jgi:homoserine acetyltransferase